MGQLTRIRLLLSIVALIIIALAPTARAGAEGSVITWGTPTTISSDTNVSTAGSLVAAFNMFGPDVSVNGVTFSAFNVTAGSQTATNGNFTFTEVPGTFVPNNTFGSAQTPFASLSTNYKTLLSTAISTSDNNTLTLEIDNLVLGQTYQFEFWVNASTFNANIGYDTTATSPNPVTLDSNTTNANGGVGQFVIGTFFCGSPSQFITFNGTNSTQAPTVNAFELRIVPEPSTMSILFLGGIAFSAARFLRRNL
jgi:hypothetical protein